MIYVTQQPPPTEVLQLMEDVHPEPIRWDIGVKVDYVRHTRTYGYWMYENSKCIGEYLANGVFGNAKILQGASISILPEYTGKGYAKALTEYVLDQAKKDGFEQYVGEARPGASWHIIQSLGGVETGISFNHGETGEDYIEFCLDLAEYKKS